MRQAISHIFCKQRPPPGRRIDAGYLRGRTLVVGRSRKTGMPLATGHPEPFRDSELELLIRKACGASRLRRPPPLWRPAPAPNAR